MGCMKGSAGSPDIIKKNISSVWTDGDTGVDFIGRGSLAESSFSVGTDLDGVFVTHQKIGDLII